jgi:hypothetical protein
MKNEILTLTINAEPLKRIISGEKVEEYRSISKHYFQLFCNKRTEGEHKGKFYVSNPPELNDYKKIEKIRLQNGYSLDRPFIIIGIKMIRIEKFVNYIPESMKPGTECFTLYLGNVIEFGNLEKLK